MAINIDMLIQKMGIIKDNLELLYKQIEKAAVSVGRIPNDIQVVAVTKGRSIDMIQEAFEAGIVNFGENYLQEALPKIAALQSLKSCNILWHFLGNIQSNKTNKICGNFQWIHSLTRISSIKEIVKYRDKHEILPKFLIEVKLSNVNEEKQGILPKDLELLCEKYIVPSSIPVIGLMTMAGDTANTEEIRLIFRTLRQLAEKVTKKRYPGVEMKHLSMGMSNDFFIAIQEGATIIRIGRGIFGPFVMDR